jgi:hypothetical protein
MPTARDHMVTLQAAMGHTPADLHTAHWPHTAKQRSRTTRIRINPNHGGEGGIRRGRPRAAGAPENCSRHPHATQVLWRWTQAMPTGLRPNSLLTGKNAGNLARFAGLIPVIGAVSISFWSTSYSERILQPQTEQGIIRSISGNCNSLLTVKIRLGCEPPTSWSEPGSSNF